MIKKALTGLVVIVSTIGVFGCNNTTKPASTDDCITITVETKDQTKKFYYCDSASVSTAQFILRYLEVK